MGVEPTSACAAQPLTGFEDRGIHRDTSTPSRNAEYNPARRTGKVSPYAGGGISRGRRRQPYFIAALSGIIKAYAKPDQGANDARLPLGPR